VWGCVASVSASASSIGRKERKELEEAREREGGIESVSWGEVESGEEKEVEDSLIVEAGESVGVVGVVLRWTE
jgi:hypothetical protein